ncbi:MAG: fibronectin type III domain-containing protein [Bacteroidota bacterium]
MRPGSVFLALVLAAASAVSQNITRLEYFFDADPGYGKGTQVAITPGASINDLTFDINVSGLTDGFHSLYLRTSDANGRWSALMVRPVYKLSASTANAPLPALKRIEYFLNTDPGYGKGRPLSFTPGTTVNDLYFEPDLAGLPETTNLLVIRALDAAGRWSQLSQTTFEVCNKPPTIAFEPTDLTSSGFTASWELVPEATNYLLDISTDNFKTFVSGYQARFVLSTSLSVTGFTQGTAYQYRVRAVSGCASVYSNTVSVTTPVALPAGQPSGLQFANATESSFTITYNPASGPPSGYLVIRRAGASPTFVPQNDTDYAKGQQVGDGTVAYKGPVTLFAEIGLLSGTIWHYDIFSYNQLGNLITYRSSAPLEGSYYTKAVEPSAQPTALSFQSVSSSGCTVSFTAAAGTPAGYIVFRRTGSAPTFVPVDGTTYTVNTNYGDARAVYIGPNTSFTESGLSASTNYFYSVYAYNGSGLPVNYRTASPLTGNVTTALQEPGGQPSGLTFPAVTSTSLNVAFTPATGSPAATGYLALRRAGSSPDFTPVYNTAYTAGQEVAPGIVVAYSGTGKEFPDGGLTSSTTYYYDVFSYYESGGLRSYRTVSPLEGSATTFTGEPAGQPSGVVFSGITSVAMRVSFTAASPNPGGYLAIRKAGSAPAFRPADGQDYALNSDQSDARVVYKSSASALFFDDAGLQPGVAYHYIVFSYNGSGASTNYNVSVGANTGSSVTVPGKPVVLTASGVLQSGFTARWEAVTGATGYRLDVSKDNFVSLLAAYDNLTVVGTSTGVTALQPGTVYKYRVRAVNGSGTSVNSDDMQQQTLPATPDAPTAGSVEQTTMTISWNAVTPADGYYLDVSPDDFVNFSAGYNKKQVAAPPVSVTGLSAGQTYKFRVRSYNAAGESPVSAVGQQLLKPGTPVQISTTETLITPTGFVAQWNKAEGAAEYYLDVVLASSGFSSPQPAYVTGYENKKIPLIAGQEVYQETITGLSPATGYVYRVRAKNATGYSAYSPQQAVLTKDKSVNVNLVVSDLRTSSTDGTIGSADVTADIDVSGGTPPIVVKFIRRKIGAADSTVTTVAPSGSTYRATITPAMANDIGVEFYFQVSDGSGFLPQNKPAVPKRLYRSVPAGGEKIPFTRFGGELKDYELFSIPYKLEDKDIDAVFAIKGAYDKTRWRVLRWNARGEKYDEFESGLKTIEAGKGYWFNQRVNEDILIDKPTLEYLTGNDLFKITLDPGWNQIGNPLPFAIKWSDVQVAKGNPATVGGLYVYNAASLQLVPDDNLPKWGAGFVVNNSATEVEMVFPKTLSQGRSAETGFSGDAPVGSGWQVPVTVEQSGRSAVSGVGMRTDASSSFDRYDALVPPPWGPPLSMYVDHPETVVREYSRDIVAPQESYVWSFTVTSSGDREVTLQWDPRTVAATDGQLVLVDEHRKTFVNMRESGSYVFVPNGSDRLKIMYAEGGEVPVADQLAGHPYPNPMSGVTTIPFSVAQDGCLVEAEIIDVLGTVQKRFSAQRYSRGIHSMEWHGEGRQGDEVSAGLYLVRLRMNGVVFVRQIIKR